MKNTLLPFILSFGLTVASTSFAAQSENQLTFQKSGVQAHLRWEKGPVSSESETNSIFKIEFVKIKDHLPIALKRPPRVWISMKMGDMQHSTLPPTIESVQDADGKSEIGVYRVSQINFSMSGKWDIKIEAQLPDHKAEIKTYSVEVKDSK